MRLRTALLPGLLTSHACCYAANSIFREQHLRTWAEHYPESQRELVPAFHVQQNLQQNPSAIQNEVRSYLR
jgi:hypothetical protein